MFRSSFARDLACDLRTSFPPPSRFIQDEGLTPSSHLIQDEIVDNSLSSFKSQFASEHQSFVDNYHSLIETDLTCELESMGLSSGGDVWRTSREVDQFVETSQEFDRKPEFGMAVGDEVVSAVGLWEGVGGSVKRDLGIPQKETRLPEKTATNTRPDHFHTNLENSTFEKLRQTCGDLGLEYHSQQWDCLFNLLKDERQNMPMVPDAGDQDEDAREDDKNGDNINLDEDKDQCSERLNDFILSLQSLPQTHKLASLRSGGVSDPTDAERNKNAAGNEEDCSVWTGRVGQTGGSFPWQRREAFPQHWTDTNSKQEKEIEEILESCDKFEKEAVEGEDHVRFKAIEASVERIKLEKDNAKLRKELNEMKGGEKNYNELLKEVDQLHWQLNKMENSRKTYEAATKHLVTFLDQVSSSLALSSPTKKTRLGITDNSSRNIADRDIGKFTRRTPIRVKSRHSMKSASVKSVLGSVSFKSTVGSIGGFSSMTPSETSWKPPAMLINNTPVCSSSPLQSLVEHQQFNSSTSTSDKSRKQSVHSLHIQTSQKRSNARSVSSAADCSRLGSRPNREGWRHVGEDNGSHSHSSSMESGKDSGRASDSSSSGRSTPHKEAFSMVCGSGRSKGQEKEGFSMVCGSGRSSRSVENRQQLAVKAQRLVRSIRQLLAREKKYDVDKKGKRQRRGQLGNDAPFNTKLPGSQSPWILRPHNLTVRPVSADPSHLPTDPKSQSGRLNNTISGHHESRVELICPDTDLSHEYKAWGQVSGQDHHEDRHVTVQEVDPDASHQEEYDNENLSPRTKILRSQSEKLIINKSNKIPKTTLRTSSFQQSTPKKPGTTVTLDTWPHEESLIKINSMGVVSVPVPYPVHCQQAQPKGNVLWV